MGSAQSISSALRGRHAVAALVSAAPGRVGASGCIPSFRSASGSVGWTSLDGAPLRFWVARSAVSTVAAATPPAAATAAAASTAPAVAEAAVAAEAVIAAPGDDSAEAVGADTPITVVNGSRAFRALRGKVVKSKRVIICDCGDIHPFSAGPVFEAEHVRVESCDKNWVYYWLRPHTFPNVKHIELNSHPCERVVLSIWGEMRSNGVTLQLDTRFASYKERWAGGYDNIQLSDLRTGAQMQEWEAEPEPAPAPPAAPAAAP